MRRLFTMALAVAMLLSVAAVATAAPKKDPPGKTFDRQPTPEAVTYEHIDALNNCDVDRLMAQYPESIHIVLPGGVTVEGREDVEALFHGFCADLEGLQFTELQSWKVHKTINMQWEADADFLCEPYLGADAYETWAGLMAAQVTTFDGGELKFHGDPDCPVYYTTHGALPETEVGNILSHQHMFVEFQVAPPVDYLDATFAEVWAAIGDMVIEAKDLGYDVFIEPTPLGVGRRPDIVEEVALAAELPTMLATGIYHEPYQPDWVATATVAEITDFMLEELNVGVGDTDVQAGFIKLASSYVTPSETELKVLEAACAASLETGASIASHILTSTAVADTMDALEGFGCPLDRFIWIHAPYTAFVEGEAGVDALMMAAERGAYLSHDFIGSEFWIGWVGDNSHERHFELLDAMVEAGYEDQLLIGSDTGWFDPGNENFLIEPYNQIMDYFVPFMQGEGYSDELIDKFLHENPWEAYSR